MQILFKGKRLKEEIISLFEPCFLELRLAILEMNMQLSVAVFSLFVSVLGGHNVKRSTHDRSGINQGQVHTNVDTYKVFVSCYYCFWSLEGSGKTALNA